eukprot:1496379-Rhodomonas_salina.1
MVVVFAEGAPAVFNQVSFARMPGITRVDAVGDLAATSVEIDDGYVGAWHADADEDSNARAGGESSAQIIAGVAGGVGGVLAIGAAGYWVGKRRSEERAREAQAEAEVQTLDLNALKASLSEQVCARELSASGGVEGGGVKAVPGVLIVREKRVTLSVDVLREHASAARARRWPRRSSKRPARILFGGRTSLTSRRDRDASSY